MLDLQFPGDIGQPAGPARPDIFFRAAEVFEGLVGERLVVDRQVGERHIGAFLGEFKCDGLADAAGCTRYDSHFSFE